MGPVLPCKRSPAWLPVHVPGLRMHAQQGLRWPKLIRPPAVVRSQSQPPAACSSSCNGYSLSQAASEHSEAIGSQQQSLFQHHADSRCNAAAFSPAAAVLCVPACRWNGKTFKQLPEDAKQRVSDYPITCLIVRPKPAASMT